MTKKVVIVGGGASGLFAAIHAANKNTQVIILEHKDRIGKKLLMTGNGKCNLTNMSNMEGKYYSDNIQKVYQTIYRYDAKKVRDFFNQMGMRTKEKRDGGVYPVSEQAATVLDFLRLECERLGVSILINCHVTELKPQKNGGRVFYENIETKKREQIEYDSLILATGSKAAKVSGSDGSGYDLVKQLGHTLITPLPALVQLRCEGNYFKAVAGVRAQAKISLMVNKKMVADEEGELQLTEYGLSGIPVFQISRIASRALYEKKECNILINFLTYMSDEEIASLHSDYVRFAYRTIEEYLFGITHKKIATMICKKLQVKPSTRVKDITKQQWKSCIGLLTAFPVKVLATNPFDNAQVCCGGVPLDEVDEKMQSLKQKDIYLTGELLDCDGICGGYNLQWAWSTGALAGKYASE